MLIPNIVFHENPAHTEILREMLKDYQLGKSYRYTKDSLVVAYACVP